MTFLPQPARSTRCLLGKAISLCQRFWRYSVARLITPVLLFWLAAVVPNVVAQNPEEVTIFHLAAEKGDTVWMEGTINSETPAQLNNLLNANPQIRTITLMACLGSSDDDANFLMARGVRDRGLNTHLTAQSEIYSGCVDFFLAGNMRTMESGAKIGVHSWYDDDDGKAAIEYPRSSPEHEMNRKYIEDMLGSDAFYWFTIEAAPADGMYLMRDDQIAEFGLLTH